MGSSEIEEWKAFFRMENEAIDRARAKADGERAPENEVMGG